MNTLDLQQAAAFLKMHPEEVRRRARLGLLPGAKPGKSWVFIEEDLAAWIREQYRKPQAAPPAIKRNLTEWHSINAAARGGSILQRPQESELDALLKQATKPKRRNSTTG
ncbi:MAG TPA: helix-turn-helix domain-containing protein [Telluria sp.]